MGIFDFFKRKGVNKDILRAEERKKQSEERNIEIELEKLAQEAEARKVNAVKEKTDKELEKYLMSFDTNILCEDGVERRYSATAYGLINDKISQTTFKKKFIGFGTERNKVSAELEFVKKNPNIEFTKTVNIDYNGKNYLSSDDYTEVVLNVEFWFSKSGKYLLSSEIINVQNIRKFEHTFHMKKNQNYKNYFKAKELSSNENKSKRFFNKSFTKIKSFSIYKINNIYFTKNNKLKCYDFCPLTDEGLELFNGKINGVVYKDGISDSKKNHDIENYVGYTSRKYKNIFK